MKTVSNKIFKTEYFKHLRNNVFLYIWYSLTFLILCTILIIVLAMLTLHSKQNLKTISEMDYEYAVESQERYDDFSSNFKFSNIIMLSSDSGKRANINLYMALPHNDNYIGIPSTSEQNINEIAIAQNIADALNASIGDMVLIWLPTYSEPQPYTVSDITPYIWDYYNIKENSDFSAACISYNAKTASSSRGKYVYLLNEQEWEHFFSNNYSYIRKYDMYYELKEQQDHILLCDIVILTGVYALTILLYYLLRKQIAHESIKYLYNSFSNTFVTALHNTDLLVFYIVPVLIVALIYYFLQHISGVVSILDVITASGTVVLAIILTGIGGNSYGKQKKSA